MFLLLLLLIAVPIAELWFLFRVASVIGFLPALVLLFAVSIVGAWLVKREGVATWSRLQATLREGRVPSDEASDGALILLGGALLLTPGFLTDIVGLLLVFPLTRALFKRIFRTFLGGYVSRRTGIVSSAGRAGKRVYDARVVRSRRNEPAPPEITAAPRPPEDPYSAP
jgi:UPF0716 protein FxsA